MCSGTSNPDANTKRMELVKGQCDTYWTNFDRRRAHEWKVSLAIWAALAAFIALILDSKVSLPNFSDKDVILYGVIFGGAIVLLQAYFQYRVKLANDVDKSKAELYENLLNQKLDINYENIGEDGKVACSGGTRDATLKEKKVDKSIKKVQRSKGNWSLVFHIGITIILVILAVIVVLGKIHLGRSELQKATANSEAASMKAVVNHECRRKHHHAW